MFTLDTFYKSKEWERFRLTIIEERTKPDGVLYCEHCGKPIVKKYDTILHHRKELTEANVNDAWIAFAPENIQVIHFKCHNKIHKRFGFGDGGYKRPIKKVYIVYGAPCSGKSTWVNDNADDDDLIVDLDKIWQAVSVNDLYKKPDSLKSVVFDIRDKLYDIIKYRSGNWINAYVITGGALAGERERLIKRVAADKLIHIDTDKETCLLRAEEKPDAWKKYIAEWFDSYQPEDIPPGGG